MARPDQVLKREKWCAVETGSDRFNCRCGPEPERVGRTLGALSERGMPGKADLFGEGSLLRALTERTDHFHGERNHQGKGNVLLFLERSKAQSRLGDQEAARRMPSCSTMCAGSFRFIVRRARSGGTDEELATLGQRDVPAVGAQRAVLGLKSIHDDRHAGRDGG